MDAALSSLASGATEISLYRSNVTPLEAASFAKALAENATLVALDLDRNDVQATGAVALADALQLHTCLRTLELVRNNIQIDGAVALASALESSSSVLESISLDHNDIQAKGAAALASAVARNHNLRSISLNFNNIQAEGATSLGDALKANSSLRALYLRGNDIQPEGATAIAEALKVNNSLETLDLAGKYVKNALAQWRLFGNNVQSDGAAALAEALKSNTGLKKLDLTENSIMPDGGEALGEALATNSTLETLILESNKLKTRGTAALGVALKSNTGLRTLSLHVNKALTEGAEALAEALKSNTTLTSLDLWGNAIKSAGIEAIAQALEINHTLETIILVRNGAKASGAAALASTLKTNTTLTKLGLGSNDIPDEGAVALAEALKSNTSLQWLGLVSNQVEADGAAALASALESNTTLQVLECNFGSIPDEICGSIFASLERNREIPATVVSALAFGGSAPLGHVKLTVVGQRASGKTLTVRSLFGSGAAPREADPTGMPSVRLASASAWKPAPLEHQSMLARHAVKIPASTVPDRRRSSSSSRKSLTERLRQSLPRRLSRAEPSPPPLMTADEVGRRFTAPQLRRFEAQAAQNGQDVSIAVWDCFDHDLGHAVQRLFVTPNGAFLAVFDMAAWLTDQVEAEAPLKSWLDAIAESASGAPVILVGTRADAVDSDDDLNKINSDLLRLVTETHVLAVAGETGRIFFPLDNTSNEQDRADELRKVIAKTALEMPCANQDVPLAWVRVLDLMRETQQQFLTEDQAAALADKIGVQPRELHELLLLFNDTGALLFHESSSTGSEGGTIVLQPRWLADCLASSALRQGAEVGHDELEHLWGAEHVHDILNLLQSCGVLLAAGGGKYTVATQ